MPCSPLLQGVEDPLEVLAVIWDHPVLCYSEPSQTFYPLEKLGWATYGEGRWRITEEGRNALSGREPEPDSPPEFFEL